jgi:hypothetical protein
VLSNPGRRFFGRQPSATIYLYQEVQKTPIGNGWVFFYRPRPDVIDSGANDSELVLHDVAGHSHYLCMVFIVQWGC